MKSIRRWAGSLIFEAGLALLVMLHGSALMLLALSPFSARTRLVRHWVDCSLSWLRWTCGIEFRVSGSKQVPETPVIVLSKHQSTWETIALQRIFSPVTWVVKRELLWLPFFGWGLRLIRAIAIDRSSGRQSIDQIVEQGRERLDAGISVVVFPEGTRMPPGTRRRYRLGGAILGVETGYPVVPVAHNAGLFWGRRKLLKQSGCIEMRIGAPINPEGKTAEQLIREVEDWIEGAMEEMSGGPATLVRNGASHG